MTTKIFSFVLVTQLVLTACGINPVLPGNPPTQTPYVITATQAATSIPTLAPTAAPTLVPTTVPTQVPTLAPTLAPTATVVPTPATGKADVRAKVGEVMNQNNWTGVFYDGVTDQIKSWANNLKTPDKKWSEPPNADSPSHSFKKENGMIWPNGESHYGQWGSKADMNVPALHVRVYTGDFSLAGIGECRKIKDTDAGCALIIVNVGDVTAMFRDGMYDYGWTTTGPYFNGDKMSETLWAVTSHVSYNTLNVAGGTNLGANCSVAGGCLKEHFTLSVISGNQVLMVMTTTVSR